MSAHRSGDSTGPPRPVGAHTPRWNSPRADRTLKVGESLAELTRQLGTAPPDTLSAIFSRWSEVVGEAVAAHARPERTDGDSLIVCVDSPAWASHLRTLAPRVISQLHDATGSDQVSRLVVRMKVAKKAPDLDI